MTAKTRSAYALELSRELLDDIELDRLEPDKLLLKCLRLARLVGSEETELWLKFEIHGYVVDDPTSVKCMTETGRWVDHETRVGTYGTFAHQIDVLNAANAQLAALRLPSVSGEWSHAIARERSDAINSLQRTISAARQIISSVIGKLHAFVAEVYFEREFSTLAESAFARYEKTVDARIATSIGDTLRKVPAVVDGLSQGSAEAVGGALTVCRRILETFADSIYPPTHVTVELDGKVLKLDASKHQNRINVYIANRTESDARRKRLRQNLANLFDSVSNDLREHVTADEAFSLYLNTYLFLGEVLLLGDEAEPNDPPRKL